MLQQKNTMIYGGIGAAFIILGLVLLLSGGGDEETASESPVTEDGGQSAVEERRAPAPLVEDAGFPKPEPAKPLIADELMLEVGPELALPESAPAPTGETSTAGQKPASLWQVVAAGKEVYSYKYWDIYTGLPGNEPAFLSSRESRKYFTFKTPPGVVADNKNWFLLDGLVDPVIIVGMRWNQPYNATDLRLVFDMYLEPQAKGGWGVWLGGLWRNPELPGGRRHVITEDVEKIIELLGSGQTRKVIIRFRRYTDALARKVTRKTTEVDGVVVHAVDFYFHSDLIMPLAASGTKAYVGNMVIETMGVTGNK